jgi:hypothetical protein
MTEHNTVLQQPRTVAQQTQNSTRAGSHRLRNCGFPSSLRSVPDIVIDVLRSPGDPMDETVRREMESKIAGDFSDVRLHTGPKATAAAESIDARAFTYGKHIVFNQGEYRPETTAGKKLLAHELVHVVQQTGGVVQPEGSAGGEDAISEDTDGLAVPEQSTCTVRAPVGPAEREAKRVAERVVAMEPPGDIPPSKGRQLDTSPLAVVTTTDRTITHTAGRRRGNCTPAFRVSRSIQREETEEALDKAEKEMLSDVIEIPRDDYDDYEETPLAVTPGSMVTAKTDSGEQNTMLKLPTSDTYALHTLEGDWSVAAPVGKDKLLPNGTKRVVGDDGDEKVIPVSEAEKIRTDWQSTLRGALSDAGYDKTVRETISSGKPGGKKVGDPSDRIIRGPAEQHFFAAGRALNPDYNDGMVNISFCQQRGKKGVFSKGGGRKIGEFKGFEATTEPKFDKIDLTVEGSITDWEKRISNMFDPDEFGDLNPNDFMNIALIMSKSLGVPFSDVKKEIKTKSIYEHGFLGVDRDIDFQKKLYKVESARLLAGLLRNPFDTPLVDSGGGTTMGSMDDSNNPSDLWRAAADLFGQLNGPFIREHLDGAVQLMAIHDQRTDSNKVSKVIGQSEYGYPDTANSSVDAADVTKLPNSIVEHPKDALFNQSLINMGIAVARGIHQIGEVTAQYLKENNKNWGKVKRDELENKLTVAYKKIMNNTAKLLDIYGIIIKGIRKYQIKKQAAKQKQINDAVGDFVTPVKGGLSTAAGIGISALAGSSTGGLAVMAELTLIVGINMASRTVSEIASDITTTAPIQLGKINTKWNSGLMDNLPKFQAETENEIGKIIENSENIPTKEVKSTMGELRALTYGMLPGPWKNPIV